MRALAAAALCGLCIAGLGAAGPATGGSLQRYTSVVTGAYLGGGVFAGRVTTPGVHGKINGRSVRRRCANRRRVESSTHKGDFEVGFRTTAKGFWRFFLPPEPGRRIKVFVLAKELPGGSFCSFAKTVIHVPELPAP